MVTLPPRRRINRSTRSSLLLSAPYPVSVKISQADLQSLQSHLEGLARADTPAVLLERKVKLRPPSAHAMSLLSRAELEKTLVEVFDCSSIDEQQAGRLAAELGKMSSLRAESFSKARLAYAFGSQSAKHQEGNFTQAPASILDANLSKAVDAVWAAMAHNDLLYGNSFCAVPGDRIQLAFRLVGSDASSTSTARISTSSSSSAVKGSFVLSYTLELV